MHFYTYIIYSSKSDRYYIGSSSDPKSRLERHNAGVTKSTKPYRPWKIVYTEEFKSKTEALKRENEIKRMKSRQYLEKLIGGSD